MYTVDKHVILSVVKCRVRMAYTRESRLDEIRNFLLTRRNSPLNRRCSTRAPRGHFSIVDVTSYYIYDLSFHRRRRKKKPVVTVVRTTTTRFRYYVFHYSMYSTVRRRTTWTGQAPRTSVICLSRRRTYRAVLRGFRKVLSTRCAVVNDRDIVVVGFLIQYYGGRVDVIKFVS